jgi:hypothetical protein
MGDFKRLTHYVIDVEKGATRMVFLENAGAYSPE